MHLRHLGVEPFGEEPLLLGLGTIAEVELGRAECQERHLVCRVDAKDLLLPEGSILVFQRGEVDVPEGCSDAVSFGFGLISGSDLLK